MHSLPAAIALSLTQIPRDRDLDQRHGSLFSHSLSFGFVLRLVIYFPPTSLAPGNGKRTTARLSESIESHHQDSYAIIAPSPVQRLETGPCHQPPYLSLLLFQPRPIGTRHPANYEPLAPTFKRPGHHTIIQQSGRARFHLIQTLPPSLPSSLTSGA